MIIYRPAFPSDAYLLAESLRQEDVEEIHAGGYEPLQALVASINASHYAMVADSEKGLVAVYGMAPSSVEKVFHPWMLCTDLVKHHPLQCIKQGRAFLDVAESNGYCLMNHVHEKSTTAISYLIATGFNVHLDQGIEHEQTGAIFLPFDADFRGEGVCASQLQ